MSDSLALGDAATPSASRTGSSLLTRLDDISRRKKRNDRIRRIARGMTGLVAILVLWHLMSVSYNLQLLLPTPFSVFQNVVATLTLNYPTKWLYGPNIYEHLASSAARALIGFSLAAAVAIPLGIVVGWSKTVREFVDPPIRAFYPIPGIAWIPLAILWFGLGNTAVIFVVFLAEFFPLYFNTESGVRNINPVLVDAGRCYGAKNFTLLRRVVLPAAFPYIITGMRIALGGAWRMIVAGEMLASQAGIGSVLTEARYQFRAVDLMMAMILISIIGYLCERLLIGTLEKRTIERWEVKKAG
jgi:ABC-type nitrate/sulfonate/bicarbonate transport system permease component